MTKFRVLREMLAKDPFFSSLFHGAADAHEAIKVASLYGLSLSMEDVTTFQKEFAFGRKAFTMSVQQPMRHEAWGGGGGGYSGDVGIAAGSLGSGECSGFDGGCFG